MSLRYAILGILEATPMTGYELGQRFASSAHWVWAAPMSQIYPLLTRMEADELIVGEERVVSGRTVRRYSVSERGRAALVEWVGESHPAAPVRDPLLLQALFLDLLPAERAEAVLRTLIAEERERVAGWRTHRDELAAGETPVLVARLQQRPTDQHDRIKRIKATAFEGLVALGEARIEWAERMIDAVSAPTD